MIARRCPRYRGRRDKPGDDIHLDINERRRHRAIYRYTLKGRRSIAWHRGERMQVLVIGAGVVGLAIARQAALAGHDVIVAEAENHIGSGTSSRNSEVIHAGIYYPTGSLRERHCARSRRMLYAYCDSHGVPYRKVGKLIVIGRDEDRPSLEKLLRPGDPQRRRRPADAGRRRGDAHGARARLRRRVPFAGNRDHRQPPLHAGAARRPRRPRRRARLQHPGRANHAGARGLRGAIRRRRAGHAHGGRRRQFRGARRAGIGAGDRRLPGRAGAAALPRQGQLLRLHGPARSSRG